ncbi:hypothetical protein SDC9_00716 [bioreactor metagenome]|jgi:hypothetical protein|uniref:Uncharacterized protein n=1 Tax=bioreactor metagenome TaxID=1076179 RepID=A0A644SKU1_9ZZZZ
MTTFVRLIEIQKFKKVTYYSVILEEELNSDEDSLFEIFINKHTKENKTKLSHILSWIKIIGNQYGAREDIFRPEHLANALPPKGKDREPTFLEDGETEANNLRLYCLRVNENVVFLFNGDIKTAKKAQDCKNVEPHFRLANILTKKINELFISKEISWNEDCTEISIDDNYYFEI